MEKYYGSTLRGNFPGCVQEVTFRKNPSSENLMAIANLQPMVALQERRSLMVPIENVFENRNQFVVVPPPNVGENVYYFNNNNNTIVEKNNVNRENVSNVGSPLRQADLRKYLQATPRYAPYELENRGNKQKTNAETKGEATTACQVTSAANSSESSVVRSSKFSKDKSKGVKVFTGTVEKVLKWHKLVADSGVDYMFEVIATCISMRPGVGCEKHLLLRDTSGGPVMQAVYYEIDFALPKQIRVGSNVRIIGKMISLNRLKIFKAREVIAFESAATPRLMAITHHMINKIHAKMIANLNKNN